MPGTAGYQAGVEAGDAQISYGSEVTWGVPPATTFQAIRFMGETLADKKTRQRPAEILNSGEVAPAVTTQEMAAGDITYALTYTTFDDFIAGAFDSSWSAKLTLAGVAADITITNVTGVTANLTSTTAAKFAAITQGMWIRLLGFTNANNNGFYYVKTVTDSTHLVLTSLKATITETPTGTNAQIRASSMQNGNVVQTFFLQKKFSPTLWLTYPGSYCSGMTFTGGVNTFMGGKFTFLCQSETSATVDSSTGGIVGGNAASQVMDPAGSFAGLFFNEAAVVGTLDSYTITLTSNGATTEFGMGATIGAGIVRGTLEVSGTIKMYFKDFTLYARFKNEATGRITLILTNNLGNAYVVTLLNGAFMNPVINAGGPGQPVFATFVLEGNPQLTGGTIQIDRLPAT